MAWNMTDNLKNQPAAGKIGNFYTTWAYTTEILNPLVEGTEAAEHR